METSYAFFIAAATLDRADLIRQRRRERGMSNREEAAYERLEQEYLDAIESTTNEANMRIVVGLQQLVLPDANDSRGEWDGFIDGLLGC